MQIKAKTAHPIPWPIPVWAKNGGLWSASNWDDVKTVEQTLDAGNLNFHSSSYDWLVVAGTRAQYKGAGTINGVLGNFGFLLTAIDGQITGGGGTDKFRIKIWEKIGDIDGDIVYDNQMGATDTDDPTTAISGGSIVIHSK
jgi:hypothetical protein